MRLRSFDSASGVDDGRESVVDDGSLSHSPAHYKSSHHELILRRQVLIRSLLQVPGHRGVRARSSEQCAGRAVRNRAVDSIQSAPRQRFGSKAVIMLRPPLSCIQLACPLGPL